ncbi:hypothetical protein HDU89_007537 [Geranomyces variabilis]|nr:hypothetical protein HDU89_007537 [Geranomyces variabilis]
MAFWGSSFLSARVRRRLPDLRFLLAPHWRPLWALAAMSALGLLTLVAFHTQIFAFLNRFANAIHGLGFAGWVLMLFLQFISCFPPLVGYGTLLYLQGYIYGFPGGFIPAYVGALSGAVVCFIAARRWLDASHRARFVASFPKWRAVEEVVEKGGLKLLVLIRLAPYPYGLMSLLLATTTVPLGRFIKATALSLLKTILHIYIGSTVRDLSETTNLTPARLAATVFGTVVAVIVMVVLTVEVRRVLERAEAAAGVGGSGEEMLLGDDKADDEMGKRSDSEDDGNGDGDFDGYGPRGAGDSVDYVELEDGIGDASFRA